MTIEINLLPWRALKRQEEKKTWIILWLMSLILGVVVLCSRHYDLRALIHHQEHRNALLQEEIVLFRQQIQEIHKLLVLRQLLISHIQTIKKLQINRILIVHFFDELVKAIPDGIYLTYAERVHAQIKLLGQADSNHAISVMMHHIELSAWFDKPILTEIKKTKRGMLSSANEFKLNFVLREKA